MRTDDSQVVVLGFIVSDDRMRLRELLCPVQWPARIREEESWGEAPWQWWQLCGTGRNL